ncbi:MAG: hypothetical protein ACRDJE_14140 [Dehalococcoidia bacterium]
MRRFLYGAIAILALAVLAVPGFESSSAAAATPTAQGTPATFRGTANGRDTSHSVDLQPGLVVVHGRHSGGRNFILSLVLPKPGVDIQREYEESVHIFNEIGQYNGGAAEKVPVAGTYILNLQASGSYEITIEQPPLSQMADPGQLEFSGEGHQVTPAVVLPGGTRRITFIHDGEASFGPRGLGQVFLLDMNGNTVSGDTSGRLFNEFGPFEGAVEVEIILEEPHIFHVDATGSWTIRID